MLSTNAFAFAPDRQRLAYYAQHLHDVMELIDPQEIEAKLQSTQTDYQQQPTPLNALRLGIIYHEAALNFSFFGAEQEVDYTALSLQQLTDTLAMNNLPAELQVYAASYHASALTLRAASTKNLLLIERAFRQLRRLVRQWAPYSYLPEFIRGSIAENLPLFYWRRRRRARGDFASIIDKYEADPSYAPANVMSFTYWACAKQCAGTNRTQALCALDKAIALDPTGIAGRPRAEQLRAKLSADH